MSNDICGIVLDTNCVFTQGLEVNFLGKTSLEWVKIALGKSLCGVVNLDKSSDLLNLIKPLINVTRKYTVVLYSDTPLVRHSTVETLIRVLVSNKLQAVCLSRGWVFDTQYLIGLRNLPNLTPIDICETDFCRVDNFRQVANVTRRLKDRILDYHMDNGVYIMDRASTFVDCEVQIGKGVTIHPNNTIKNKTEVKENAVLLPGNTIDNCIIDCFAQVHSSVLDDSYVGKHTSIGPFARLRPDSIIGDNCKIGNFVEIKKSLIGDGTKIAHHTYIGDAQVGKNCNFGCGVVVANFDGAKKNPTRIGSQVFVGANSTLIAPIVLESKAFVAAGSTLNSSVPCGSLAIARARQINKPDWTNKTN